MNTIGQAIVAVMRLFGRIAHPGFRQRNPLVYWSVWVVAWVAVLLIVLVLIDGA